MLSHWNEKQIFEFLTMQFDAQRSHYQTHYSDARFDIIEQDGERIGRLYLAEMDREFRLMDIALLPGLRNQGIGSRLTRDILDLARQLGWQVTLHVEDENPARRLYQRLGFTVVGEQSFYKKMSWQP